MLSDQQFLFIIGAPRSGTTWLQAMLAAHPSVCSTVDELKLFDFFTVPLEDGWRYLLRLQNDTGGDRNGLAAIWSDEEFYGFLSDFVERVYAQVLARKPSATILLDKAPAYSNCVEHIDRLVPRAKFIHMIRDGRDVAVSLMAAAQGWGRLWAPNSAETAASIWKSHVLAAQTARQYAERYLEVRYEDLLTNGTHVLRGVFDFTGVPIADQELDAIYQHHQFEDMKRKGTGAHNFVLPKEFFRKGQSGDWHNSLDAVQRYIFNETAGDLLRELGYSNDGWWAERRHHRLSAPLIAALSNRSRMQAKALRTIKRGLGPRWTERLRVIVNRTRRIHSPVNG